MNIGDNIKILRKHRGWSQEQMASKCGLSKNAIWNYENRKRTPNIGILSKIADTLGILLNELIEPNGMEENIYKEAVQTFGINSRVDLCIEEMAELTQAISKFKRGLTHNIEEEMVDVEIMLEQLRLIFNPHMLEGYKYSKIEKLKNTIKEARESAS